MAFISWMSEHGGTLLQNIGIIAGLLFSGASFRLSAEVHRISQVHRVTAAHRDLWSQLIQQPGLARILEPEPDIENHPITPEEERFVTLLILHLRAVHQTLDLEPVLSKETVEKDIQHFFNLPIPKEIWKKIKTYQESEFTNFVTNCFKSDSNNPPRNSHGEKSKII